jgi:hypothetical protein
MVATIKNLQRPCKLLLDSDTGGCYAFYAYNGRLAAFVLGQADGVLAVFIFVLDNA